MELGSGYMLPAANTVLRSRYRIVRVIGHGGMGAVLEALDEAADGQRVAVKVLQPHIVANEVQRQRFIQELSFMRRLHHPNIVRILDSALDEPGLPFFVMEYVEGVSLGSTLDGGRTIEPKHSCRLLADILAALDYAHRQGVVHRDLKPDNVLLDSAGIPKLADFGLARSLDIELSLTPSGETVGTPLYMAPEQFRGGKVDGRADLYALGIIAFELIAGHRPFEDDNYLKVAAMHLSWELPRLQQIAPETPNWLVDFIDTCCEKQPKHRFASAGEALRELEVGLSKMSGEQAGLPSIPGGRSGVLSRISRLFRRIPS